MKLVAGRTRKTPSNSFSQDGLQSLSTTAPRCERQGRTRPSPPQARGLQLRSHVLYPVCHPSERGEQACTLSKLLIKLQNMRVNQQTAPPVPGRLPGKQRTALKGTGGAGAEAPLKGPCQPLSPDSLWSGAPHGVWTEQSELCFLENTEIQESNLFQLSLNYYIFPQF